MRIDQRVPDLSDKELENLHANAVRLAQSGTPTQREQAEVLLPLLAAAMEERRASRVAAQATKRRSSTRRNAIAEASAKGNVDE